MNEWGEIQEIIASFFILIVIKTCMKSTNKGKFIESLFYFCLVLIVVNTCIKFTNKKKLKKSIFYLLFIS